MILYEIRHKISNKVWRRSAQIMGRVIQYRPGNFRLSGLVLSSSKDHFYSPSIAADGTFFCDCQGFLSTQRFADSETLCSHLVAMLRKAEFDGFNIEKYINGLLGKYVGEDDVIYETSLEAYNTLFKGLRGGRQLSGIASPPEVGKSYLNGQWAVDMAVMHNKNTLIIDTEGGFESEWIQVIAERLDADIDVKFINWRVTMDTKNLKGGGQTLFPVFDYKNFKITEPTKSTIYIYDARHIVQVLPFFGRPLSYKIKGGVIEPIESGGMVSIVDSPIGTLVEKCNIGMVVLDSLSAPIESFFTGGQINYRTRAKTTQALLGRAQDLVDEYKIVFMNTAHATIQHNNPYADPSIVGGKAVLHNIKYCAYMEKDPSKAVAKKAKVDWRNLRRMMIYRHPMKTPFREKTYLITTDAGVIDFDKTPYLKKAEGDEE